MKKLMSFVLVAFLIAGSVGLNVCADEDILVQLSTDKDDYIIHTSVDRVSSSDDALIVEKTGASLAAS